LLTSKKHLLEVTCLGIEISAFDAYNAFWLMISCQHDDSTIECMSRLRKEREQMNLKELRWILEKCNAESYNQRRPSN
jgi:hypothetical protein